MSLFHMFPGGIHPHEGMNGKAVTSQQPIVEPPQPSRVVVPLQQHIGAPCKCLVQKGDKVLAGQMIGEPVGFVSAAVHSSVSGTVVGVQPSIMANGLEQPCVVIDNDFQDTWVDLHPVENPESLTGAQLSDLARKMGLVGLGGATFPHAVKFAVPPEKKVDTLVLNGAECEPYLSADDQLMRTQAEKIVSGAVLIQKVLHIAKVVIGIEKNKPEAIAAMQKAVSSRENVTVVEMPVRYPQGGEKQLVYALTGRKVRAGGLPLDSGVIVCNVGSAYALHRAVYEGRPLVDRVVTVGGCVKKPANYLARIGTPIEWLIDTSEGLLPETKMLIYGGPMMGMAISRQDIPVTKGCSGVLALEKVAALAEEGPCIRCGRCLAACPMQLQPALLDRYVRQNMFDEADKAGVMNCMECGACAWSCPAKRNLTQSCRTGKKIITQRRKEAAQKKKEGK
ncbi:MAG: electron transport complex subunit RsxC [Eubacteriales bacterium]|nr:electron transport complex subunit RsxC [Eubacteriales bacterium]